MVDAESGEEALEICRTCDIGLIISDWMMPGISGVEFCRIYREMTRDRPGYFILLTAQTDREVLAEGLESGADDFLSKPVSSIELHARLRAGERVLNAQRALSVKNAELRLTLDKLSEAYSAIDRDLREARRFQEGLVPDASFLLRVPMSRFCSGPAAMSAATWSAIFRSERASWAFMPSTSRAMGSARRS